MTHAQKNKLPADQPATRRAAPAALNAALAAANPSATGGAARGGARRASRLALAALILAFGLLAACQESDVVATVARSSFDSLAAALGDRLAWSDADGAFVISSGQGDTFAVAADFGRDNGMAMGKDPEMANPDLELDFDAAPFLAAGLDPARLPRTDTLQYLVEDGRFMLHFDWGNQKFAAPPASAATVRARLAAVFGEILRLYRERIGYHEKLDHYGFALGDGNMFEWAKDMAANDKDMVFVLNPEPLAKAGLDPAKVAGWLYAKVEVKDAAGKTQLVDKLLKPFNLK